MVIEVPQELMYSIDRAHYDQKIAITNMTFMLSKHIKDETAEFLESDVFKRLQYELVLSTANRWCREITVIKTLLGYPATKYSFDDTRALLMVETEKYEKE